MISEFKTHLLYSDTCGMFSGDRIHRDISLSSSFPFVSGEVLPATVSPLHLIVFSTLLCLLSFTSGLPPLLPSSHLFITVLPSQPIGIPRLLLPCSRNSAALFGSLSSATLSTCPANCILLLASLSVKLFCLFP